jgi:putative thiamine transport system permease protein
MPSKTVTTGRIHWAAHPAAAALLTVAALPLVWSLWGAVHAALDAAAWRALWNDGQTLRALAMSVWTGLVSTALATVIAAWVLCATFTAAHRNNHAMQKLARWLSPMLAVPHAAFAIGLILLVAPSGWLLRVFSPWATGWDAPPPWPTTQDPWGLGLILVLVLKEVPFLLWAALAYVQRPDVARRLRQELQLAHTLGYSAHAAWWRVAWPQVLPRMSAPLLAVLAYGLTVVDVALVIGPSSPPTLGVLAWQWLQDADAAMNAQGVAAAWALAAVVALCALLAWGLAHLPLWRALRTRGVVLLQHSLGGDATQWLLTLLLVAYAAVLLALLLGSVMGSWPFPQLLPDSLSLAAWQSVWASSATLWTTVWLALCSATTALVWVVVWLEWAPARWQARAQAVWYLPLVLPAVLWVVGLHQLALAWNIDAQGAGLWLAHTLACLPYVLLALSGPYTGFDARLSQVAASLGRGRMVFLWQVKWPLLRAALAASFAVGFAVSVAQYLPTLYVGAGRFATVTTEAVNLAAGGQRTLMAAYAWLQWLLPVAVFALAAALGQPRRFAHETSHNSRH